MYLCTETKGVALSILKTLRSSITSVTSLLLVLRDTSNSIDSDRIDLSHDDARLLRSSTYISIPLFLIALDNSPYFGFIVINNLKFL